MKTFYLVRHAQSESNAGLRVRPNASINITELGKTQAQALSQWLQTHINTPINHVFVSSYVRTQQTAQPFLQAIGLVPQVLDELYEFNYLDFERIKDLSFAQIVQLADAFWVKGDIHHQDAPNTDSYANFVARVQSVLQSWQRLPDGTYVVFGHGMWLGMLMWQLLHQGNQSRMMNMKAFRQFELSIRPKNCEVFALVHTEHWGISKVRSRSDE